MVARVVTTLQLFVAETCNKFLKIEHHDSIVYSKHELILTFLAGATSDFTVLVRLTGGRNYLIN